jgi:branched-chain amino acid transport system ATP-binding protein
MSDQPDQLRLNNVCAGYGATVILEDMTLCLGRGEALSIIGRNGVGKSTLLKTILGQTTLHGGTIYLGNTDITDCATYQRIWRGLGYVPQEREVFQSLSVQENFAVVAKDRQHTAVNRIYELFPLLYERRNHMGNQLSGGEQQMLAIGRALLSNPSVLLMDEPSEGLAPAIVDKLQSTMQALREQESLAIILVEQNSRVALDFAERCIVMNRGQIVRDGPSAELRSNVELLDRLVGVDIASDTDGPK